MDNVQNKYFQDNTQILAETFRTTFHSTFSFLFMSSLHKENKVNAYQLSVWMLSLKLLAGVQWNLLLWDEFNLDSFQSNTTLTLHETQSQPTELIIQNIGTW